MKKATQSQIETFHEFNILLDSREIFLHGYDIEDSGTDHRMAVTFIKNLRVLERSNQPIIIHSYNIGGDWYSGMAIFDAIKQSSCNFIFICHGICASMGSIIPQAVLNKGYRIAMPNCAFLIHEGDLYLEGIHTQVSSNLAYMNTNKESMYNIYCDSCVNAPFFEGYSRSKVKAYLKRKIREKTDWCLDANEALDYGFIDVVLGEEEFKDIKTILKRL